MPQFEPTWFASQIFWLVIVFYLFYRLLKSRVVPGVASLLAERDARIQGDLELAQRRRDELEEMRAAYEANLASARAEAQAELASAQARMAQQQAAALEQVGQELAAQATEAEKRIAAEKDAALADIRTVAVEVATAASGRLSGGSVDAARIESAVDASMEARR
ncbi:MAG: F0F1 ATP synthase subunit B' [Alphaproteobacteria bacterium]|nr:F0F1 ATP synthase subunit B' [Alphaproteobacteria bacterium]MCB9931156.1 F0F1 ATP synthase subunit B' [Alphaproteobacteria bacterium]